MLDSPSSGQNFQSHHMHQAAFRMIEFESPNKQSLLCRTKIEGGHQTRNLLLIFVQSKQCVLIHTHMSSI